MGLIDYSIKNKQSELVLKNANIVNVFSNEIIKADVAIEKGIIVGIGNYDGISNIDLKGKYITPGFIDPHVHIESSMVSPSEFAKAIVPMGTTTIVTDPHEIANVCGLEGIEYILKSSENLPLCVYSMLPSCVPATDFENSGARLEARDLEKYINHDRILGLGEMMNYPGVINQDKIVTDKLELAKKYKKYIDGHIPNIGKEGLNGYILSGISTDHECSTVEEMIEKLRLGMYVMIREGSAARNLEALIKGVNINNYQRCLFCTDDKHPQDILKNGHIDNNIRLAIKNNIDPIIAIKMATINVANCYNLQNTGAIAPGYVADIVVVDNLEEFNILEVYKDGKLVGKDKKALFETRETENSNVTNTVNIDKLTKEDLKINLEKDIANVIGLLPHNLVTQKLIRKVDVENGVFKFNQNVDILKLVVIERHTNKKSIGLGLVENFKLKNGAIASTVAHDSHNIIVVGDNDEDIINAVNEIKKIGGGLSISSNNEILGSLSLPIAGLMSDKDINYVSENLENMLSIAYEKLNVSKDIEPFMTLAFLALPVIPHIKITDKGLFDVDNFKFMEI
ncbi:adenine deaminase [Acinetobacter sp. RIT592]|uniref:adenine deaminase n=1 Tax=Paraclostridium bifermentans TaxID=1490 RepID=UPI000DF79B9C|nr:adenine deaminase [Paraclostridium bifermentans]MDU3336434.1 adenine deaminase [Paraclostridium bifermentans]RDC49272.1 adenine deaminase [Acinetobacter sp. RIT592]